MQSNFWACSKKFGQAQNILEPVKGQGIRHMYFSHLYRYEISKADLLSKRSKKNQIVFLSECQNRKASFVVDLKWKNYD